MYFLPYLPCSDNSFYLLLHISRYRRSPLLCPNILCNSGCFTITALQNHRESTHTKCRNLRMGAFFALLIYFSVFLSSQITTFHLPMQILKVSQVSHRSLLRINPSTKHYAHLIYCHLQDVTTRCNPGGGKKEKTPINDEPQTRLPPLEQNLRASWISHFFFPFVRKFFFKRSECLLDGYHSV